MYLGNVYSGAIVDTVKYILVMFQMKQHSWDMNVFGCRTSLQSGGLENKTDARGLLFYCIKSSLVGHLDLQAQIKIK